MAFMENCDCNFFCNLIYNLMNEYGKMIDSYGNKIIKVLEDG